MTKDERRNDKTMQQCNDTTMQQLNDSTIQLSHYPTIALTSHIRQNAQRPGALVG